MRKVLSMGCAALAVALLAGCAGGSKDQESAKLQNFLEGSRKVEVIEKTNDKGIDAMADSSTIVYKRTGVAMRDYIEMTRGDIATIILTRQIRNLDIKDKDGIEIASHTLQNLTDLEKKNWTPEKLYKAAREKRALQFYMASRQNPELKNTQNKLQQAEIAAGKKVFYANNMDKTDWKGKLEEARKLLADAQKILGNAQTFARSLQQPSFSDIEGMKQYKKKLSVLNSGIASQCNYTIQACPWLISELTAASKL